MHPLFYESSHGEVILLAVRVNYLRRSNLSSLKWMLIFFPDGSVRIALAL